jgi:polar amino acid transport system substrate-binding protein
MSLRGRLSLLGAVAIVAGACTTGGGASSAPSAVPSAAPTAAASEAASAPASEAASPSAAASVAPIAGGLLEKIQKAGKLIVSTDPKYPPQSELKPDGTYEGFDIDVATEIAKRLGVGIEFTTPDWTAITAGGWGGRWDVSVGSMTITVDRSKVLDFSPPYYYTPAQMAASKASGITTLDGLAGKTVCSGEGTTYDQWLNGTLDYGTGQDLGKPPAGVKTTTLPTDTDCPDQWKAGRNDFEGWLSSITTVDGAIKAGLPLIKVGDPVYFEPLAVAVDKSGPADTDFLPILKQIVDDMHADGFLTAASQKWFGADFTQATP